jgi:hypothetical protein
MAPERSSAREDSGAGKTLVVSRQLVQRKRESQTGTHPVDAQEVTYGCLFSCDDLFIVSVLECRCRAGMNKENRPRRVGTKEVVSYARVYRDPLELEPRSFEEKPFPLGGAEHTADGFVARRTWEGNVF